MTTTDNTTEIIEGLWKLRRKAVLCQEAFALAAKEDGPVRAMTWHCKHAVWGDAICGLLDYDLDLENLRLRQPHDQRAHLHAWRKCLADALRDTLNSTLTPVDTLIWAARQKARVDCLRQTDGLGAQS